ncbi:MAG: hypothetical protein OXC44_06460 [Proteobacteria bacterium]|nr:hypothetical protein [Pseudomonadota bacterium]
MLSYLRQQFLFGIVVIVFFWGCFVSKAFSYQGKSRVIDVESIELREKTHHFYHFIVPLEIYIGDEALVFVLDVLQDALEVSFCHKIVSSCLPVFRDAYAQPFLFQKEEVGVLKTFLESIEKSNASATADVVSLQADKWDTLAKNLVKKLAKKKAIMDEKMQKYHTQISFASAGVIIPQGWLGYLYRKEVSHLMRGLPSVLSKDVRLVFNNSYFKELFKRVAARSGVSTKAPLALAISTVSALFLGSFITQKMKLQSLDADTQLSQDLIEQKKDSFVLLLSELFDSGYTNDTRVSQGVSIVLPASYFTTMDLIGYFLALFQNSQMNSEQLPAFYCIQQAPHLTRESCFPLNDFLQNED